MNLRWETFFGYRFWETELWIFFFTLPMVMNFEMTPAWT